jgi:hypothetical protein
LTPPRLRHRLTTSVTDRRPTTSTPTDDHVFVLIAPRYTLIVPRL